MHLNDSPFALLEHTWNAEVGSTTVGAIAVNGVVLLGAAALAFAGARWAFNKVLGAGK